MAYNLREQTSQNLASKNVLITIMAADTFGPGHPAAGRGYDDVEYDDDGHTKRDLLVVSE